MTRSSLLIFLLGLALIVCVFCCATSTTTVTLGYLAQHPRSFDGQKILLTNTGLGESSGRYLWFPSPIGDRVPVVLILIDEQEPRDRINRYTGYCLGVMDDPLPGVPVSPPFVLVLKARPVP